MKKYFAPILVCASLAAAAVNFPYPQNPTGSGNPYGRGIIATNFSHTTLKNHFVSYLQNFYEESGTLARIKFDTPQHTVSEGIGYGMLMMVYFSDNTTSYENQFVKLWNYYKNYPNQNGLMHWKINGFNSVDQENGATDGEMDVALALIMGYYQFGKQSYMDDAKALIAKIRAHEVDAQDLLKPGDVWNDKKNPSYFASAPIELFKSVESNHATRWQNVLTANYNMVKANAHGTTGLVSDWCNANGTVNGTDVFSYDAARTPWRLATAYLWFGHADAKTVNDKAASWIRSKTGESAASIRAGYNRSSGDELSGFGNGTFSGAFGSTMMSNSANQTYLNNVWSNMMGRNNEGYFNESLKILSGLLISGNMPNLASGAPPVSSSSTGTSSSGTATGGLIDDLEDGDYASNWGGEWYTYNDNEDEGASTVTPLTSTAIKFSSTANPGNGSSYAARIQFTLDAGNFAYDPFVGLGLNMRADEGYHTLQSCTEIRYRYRGAAHRFRVESSSVTNFNYHGAVVPASTVWAEQILTWADILQEDWGALAPTADLARNEVKAFSWQVQSATITTGDLWVDDVRCVGGTAPTGVITPSSSSTTNPSSSSTVISSSSGTTPSSSSVLSSSSAVGPVAGVSGFEIWGVFVDDIGSTVTPAAGLSPVVVENGINVAKANFTAVAEPTWVEGAVLEYPFVGMLMEFNPNKVPANLSGVTAITLRYRSTGNIRMALMQTGIPDGQEWGIELTPAATYTTVTIPISTLAQPDWVSAATAIRMAQTTGVKWELKEPAGGAGSISISSIEFVGYTPVSSSSTLPSSSSGGVITPSSSSTGTSSASSGAGVSGLEIWGLFVDDIGSTVTPAAGTSPVVVEGGVNVAKANFTTVAEPTWVEGAVLEYPFVGMLMEFNPNKGVENLSAVTSITLTYKSSGNIRMALMQTGITDGQEWGIELTPSAGYTTVTIPISTLAQPGWVSAATAIRMAQTTGVKWELKEPAGGAGSISIQSITFNGWAGPTPIHNVGLRSAFSVSAIGSQIHFQTVQEGFVQLEVLDMFGRRLATPVQGFQSAGSHSVQVEGLPAGLYLVRLRQNNNIAVSRMSVRF